MAVGGGGEAATDGEVGVGEDAEIGVGGGAGIAADEGAAGDIE